MMKLATTIILATAVLFFAGAQGTDGFSYNEARMDVGTLYVYTFSDFDGKNETTRYMYISGLKEIQYLENTYSIGYPNIHYFVMTFDNQFMMPYTIIAKNLLPSDNGYVSSEMKADFAAMTYSSQNEIRKNGKTNQGEETWKFEMVPQFYMGNNFVDFAYAFRFLNDNRDTVEIGVEASNRFSAMTVVRKGSETINGIDTNKYLIQGKGALAKLFNANGTIWIAKDETRALVKAEMNVRTDWAIPNNRIVLKERKLLSMEEWKQLQDSIVEEQKKNLSF